jgi:hypothetical protein
MRDIVYGELREREVIYEKEDIVSYYNVVNVDVL